MADNRWHQIPCQAILTYNMCQGPSVPKVGWRTQRGAPCEGGAASRLFEREGGGLCLQAILADCVFFPSFSHHHTFYFCASVVSIAVFVSYTLQYHFRFLSFHFKQLP